MSHSPNPCVPHANPPIGAVGLSVVVPVLNEAGGMVALLRQLAPLRARGVELLVIDGGSEDDTVALCAGLVDAVLRSARGRARQMNLGASRAQGEVLLFLHADTVLPPDADTLLKNALAAGAQWGRFDVRISGSSPMFRLIAALMNRRSRWTGIATGDQALFVRRALFERLGGFPDQPLMEDIEMSRRLRAVAAPACLRQRVTTSGRRWEEHGVWRTIALMWLLRWRYWRGTPAEQLSRSYP